MSSANVPPWEMLYSFFQNYHKGKKLFRIIQQTGGGLYGIIVVMWDNPAEPGPTRYLPESAMLGGWPNLYLASTTAFPRLNDPTLP